MRNLTINLITSVSTHFKLWLMAGLVSWAAVNKEARCQASSQVTIPATSMGHSTEVTVFADYVTIYGKPTLKTYLYYPLTTVPFTKFQLQVEASGESGDNRWPNLGIAFNDTTRILKEITINSASYQTYDLGEFSAPAGATLFLIFTNDYFRSSTADVNLKIRQAVLTPISKDTTIARGTQLTLAWNPNPEEDLKGYKIYYGLASGKYLSPTDVSKDSTSHVFPVTIGCDYFYAVSAYDTAGNESKLSPEIMVRVKPATVVATTDLNHDGKCDADDVKIFSKAFGSTCTGKRYNSEADFNGDCKIDGQDQLLFSKNCK